MSTYTVKCPDCVRSPELPFLPWMVEENCGECAQATADKHLASFPGHRVNVVAAEPEPSGLVVQLRRRQG